MPEPEGYIISSHKEALDHSVYIGLDVHKETIAISIADPNRGSEVRFYGNINNTIESIKRTFAKILSKYPHPLVCYEAGPCGYTMLSVVNSDGYRVRGCGAVSHREVTHR